MGAELQIYKILVKPSIVRHIVHPSVNKGISWCYFHGTSQDRATTCGIVFVIHLSEMHFIDFKAGLGSTLIKEANYPHCSMP